MFLSQLLEPGETLEPAAMSARLIPLAQHLYQSGWTVIASRFKTPNLFPWKAPDRTELYVNSISALQSGAANSINLRLSDTKVIALDCDFHATDLMEKFICQLGHYLSIPKSQMCTCTGAKGCKVFLRYIPEYHTARIPPVLGFKFTDTQADSAHAGNMLEIKSDVSTVAGLYGPVFGGDFRIYGPYRDYPYIIQARPESLPVVTRADIDGIRAIYERLVSSLNRFTAPNHVDPWQSPDYSDMTFSAVCAFAVDLDCRAPGTWGWNFHVASFDDWHDIARVYHCLGLHDALKIIRALFYGRPCKDSRISQICSDYQERITAMTRAQLHNRAARAESLLIAFHRCLKLRAGMRGYTLLPGLNTGALERVMYHSSGV